MAYFSGSRVESDKHYVHIFAEAEEGVEMVEMIQGLSEDIKENRVRIECFEKKVMNTLCEFKKLYEDLNGERIKELSKKQDPEYEAKTLNYY